MSRFFAFIVVLFVPAMAWAEASKPSGIEQFMPFIFIFVIFWFFIIRPQQKRAKNHKSFLSELKRGQEVLTASGIVGTVEGLTDRFITLKIDEGVNIRIVRSQIASFLQDSQDTPKN